MSSHFLGYVVNTLKLKSCDGYNSDTVLDNLIFDRDISDQVGMLLARTSLSFFLVVFPNEFLSQILIHSITS